MIQMLHRFATYLSPALLYAALLPVGAGEINGKVKDSAGAPIAGPCLFHAYQPVDVDHGQG